MSDRLTKTDKIELVETHNLMLSLNRLNSAPYDSMKWRRAFYHALAMSELRGTEILRRMREALELP